MMNDKKESADWPILSLDAKPFLLKRAPHRGVIVHRSSFIVI
jgi:hypothetical protein